MTKKTTAITDDSKIKTASKHAPVPAGMTEADMSLINPGPDKLVEITSAEDLMRLAKAAAATSDYFRSFIGKKMTRERAEQIRKLRVDDGFTWRAVAQECFGLWGDDAEWNPPSNQLAGMALCEFAAEMFEEHFMKGPWN